jgi:hypothetical protein
MSKSKNYKKYDDFDDEDQYFDAKKPQHENRRAVKNWKKVWSEHEDDYDDVDYFHGK